MLDAALDYARRGWPVVPVWWPVNGGCSCGEQCDKPGKHPIADLVEHGVSQASTNEELIRRWITKFPEMNIGIRVGERRVVLDFDSSEALARFEAEIPQPLPETLIIQTGRGVHVWLLLPEGIEIQSDHNALGKGIDIKTGNSYVVAPPSRHANGCRYFPLSAADTLIAPCPAWLLKRLLTREERGGQESGLGVDPAKVLAGVPDGQRDETIFRYASSLRARGGFSKAEARELVLLAAARCRPPFDPAIAAAKVDRAWARSENEARAELAQAGATGAPVPAKAPSAFQVITGRELLALSLPPRESVLGPFHADEAALLYARRGVGKSLVALGAAAAIAGGSEFLQWKASQPRKVLYVDGELTARMVQKRVELAAGMLAGGKEEALDNLMVLSAGINRRSPNIATEEGRRAIEEHLAGVGYLILDALSTLCRSGEENAAESWQPVQDWIVTLRAQGVPSMTLHHAGKSGLQRGTSKREDIYDWILALKHPNDYQTHQGARFEVHFEKTRDFPGGSLADPIEARIEHDGPRDFWTVKTLEVAVEEKIVSLHRDGLSNREIGREVGKHHTTVARTLKRVEKGARLAAPEVG